MKKIDFLQKLADRGYSRDEAKAALDTWRGQGRGFDDDPAPDSQPAQEPVQQQAGLGIIPKSVVNAAKGFGEDVNKSVDTGASRFVDAEKEGVLFPKIKKAASIAATGLRIGGAATGRAAQAVGGIAFDYFAPSEREKVYLKNLGGEIGRMIIPESDRAKLLKAGAFVKKGYDKSPNIVKDAADIITNLPQSTISAVGAKKAISSASGTIGDMIESSTRTGNKIVGKLAEETSGSSLESLKMLKNNPEALKKAYNTQYQIGEKIVDMVDNIDDYMPERKVVNDAIKKMPEINVDNVIKTLENSIEPDAVGVGAKTANKRIKMMIDDIKKSSTKQSAVTDAYTGKLISEEQLTVPAKKMLDIRRQIDNEAKAAFGTDRMDYIQKAQVNARSTIKNDLVEAAKKSGNDDYVTAMETWSDKIEKTEKLKRYLGKDAATREARAQSFVTNFFKGSKEAQQRVLKDFQEIYGTDVISEIKMAQLAEQIGNEGSGSWLPRWSTGRSVLSKGAGALIGSPKIAAKVTLPAMQNIENLGKSLNKDIKLRDLLKGGK
jgi:hypothetical protein